MASLAARGSPGQGQAESDRLEWLDEYGQAIELARATGKPILLELRCVP